MSVEKGMEPANILNYVGPLLILFTWDVGVTVLYVHFDQKWVGVDNLPITLIGSALALLMTLRNNNAYGRWWEARTLWGGVVNNSRTLARQVRLYLPEGPDALRLIDLQVAYAHALRRHLRRQDPWVEIEHLVSPEVRARVEGASNLPDALLGEMADVLAGLRARGKLDTIALAAFDRTLAELANMQGGAERIKNTPPPRQYASFPRMFVRGFCLILPVGLVTDLGIATPLGSSLVGFAFLALDQSGKDIENPFENSVFDVPLTAITRTIDQNLRGDDPEVVPLVPAASLPSVGLP